MRWRHLLLEHGLHSCGVGNLVSIEADCREGLVAGHFGGRHVEGGYGVAMTIQGGIVRFDEVLGSYGPTHRQY